MLINRGTDVDDDCADCARTGTWDTSRMTAPVNTAYSCRITDSFDVSAWPGTRARRHARVMGQSHKDSGPFAFANRRPPAFITGARLSRAVPRTGVRARRHAASGGRSRLSFRARRCVV